MKTHSSLALSFALLFAVLFTGCGGNGGTSSDPDAGSQSNEDGGNGDADVTEDQGGGEGDAAAEDGGPLSPFEQCEATCATCQDGIFTGSPTCSSPSFSCDICEGAGNGQYMPRFVVNCEASHADCVQMCQQYQGAERTDCLGFCAGARQNCFQQSADGCSTSCTSCYMQRFNCLSAIPVEAN